MVALNDAGFCPFQVGPPGSHFHLEFDFTDANGDVVQPGAAVKLVNVSPELNLPFFSITGTGHDGHITASICIRFNGASSAPEHIVLDDAGGQRSNTIMLSVPRPPGAN